MKTPTTTTPLQDQFPAASAQAGSSATDSAGQPPAEHRGKLRPIPLAASGRAEPASDAGTMVSRLLRTDIFRDYQQAFESITGLPLTLRQAGSFQLPLHGSKRLNPFCALMGRSNNSCAACLQLQQRVENAATHEPKTFECFAGLSESAVPVRAGETLIGYLQTGQVFLRPPTRKRFNNVLREIGGPRAAAGVQELEAAYFHTPIVAKKQYGLIIRLLAIFAQHLAALSHQVLVRAATAELPAMTKARAFILKHHREDLHLNDVARAANMSVFHFCKIFKQATGLTFTDYRARVRVESVKQMLLNPHTRVTEAAYAAGFNSPSQFNRAFRRIEGESPTTCRHRLHAPPAATASSVAQVA